MSDDGSNNTDLASSLTVAWLSNPNTRATADEATGFLQNIHATLSAISGGTPASAGAQSASSSGSTSSGSHAVHEPAVTVRKSLASRSHIISLIDGKPYVTLKRHLGTHGLTPAQYRERYGLKSDYPMVAPAYAEKRRELAIKIGLGSKGRAARKATSPASTPKAAAPNGRGRPPKAAARKPRGRAPKTAAAT